MRKSNPIKLHKTSSKTYPQAADSPQQIHTQRVYNPNRAMQYFDRLNSLVNLVVGAVNSIACNALVDAVNELRKSKHYKFKAKQEAKQAIEAYEAWERAHTKNFGDRYNLFLDYLSAAEEAIQPDIDKLYWAIKQVLDKHKTEEAALKSKIETARTLLEYAVCMYDKTLETCRKETGIDFDFLMRPARLTAALHHWTRCEDIVSRTKGETINLNNDPNCVLAFKVIENKITSEEFINRAGWQSLQENPECRKYVSDEDYEALEAAAAS